MAFAYFDRVKETTTTTGTGAIALAGAVAGFQAFNARYANGDTTHYCIFHASSGAWEVGLGTWVTGNQLQRTAVLASSNANALVNFAAGTKDVFVVYPAGLPSSQAAAVFTVVDAAARDAIPAALLRTGSIVRLLSTGLFYSWNGSWSVYNGFGAGLAAGSAGGQSLIWNGSSWVAGATDLADPDAITGKLPFGNLADGTGLSVFGRASNTTGSMAPIVGVDGQALRVSGTTLGFGTLATAAYADASVTLAKLANGTALSVLARGVNSTGPYADVISSADGQVFRRAAGVLGWGAVDLSDPDAVTGTLPFTNIATLAGLSVLGRSANTTGAMAAITGTDGQALRVSGTTLGFGTLVTAAYADSSVTLAKLANATALSVLGRSANSAGVYADIAATADGQVFRRASGTLGWGAVDLSDPDAVTGTLPFTNITSGTGLSVFGRSANTTGAMASIVGTDGQVLRVSGTTLGFGHSLGDGATNFTYNALTHIFQVGGTTVFDVDNNSFDLGSGITSIRFAAAAVNPVIIQLPDSTAGVTGDNLIFQAQSVTGTGSTVGGLAGFRGGDSTNGTGGPLAFRSGIGASSILAGGVTFGIGNTTFFSFPGTVVPSTSGILRTHHNSQVITGRDSGNAADRNGVRWGVVTDTWSFGDSAVATNLLGSSVQIGDSTTCVEVVDLGSGREVVALLFGSTISTTQMPANTGDRVLFWADATTGPTTGFPTSGGIAWGDTNFGLQWKGKNGVETTLAPHGDSGNTTKRRFIDWKSRPVLSSIAAVGAGGTTTCASFDATNFNGTTLTNATLAAKARFVTRDASGGYAMVAEVLAYVDVLAGSVTVGPLPDTYASYSSNGSCVTVVIDVSGTTVRLRLTAISAASVPVPVWAFFEVTGYER